MNKLKVLIPLSCSIFTLVIQTVGDYNVLYEESILKIDTLQHELASLKLLIYGSKNERFIPANGTHSQLSLDIQAEKVAQCSVVNIKKIEYTRNTIEVIKEHPGRTKLPEHLERREIIIEPQEKTEC
jgi:transposase